MNLDEIPKVIENFDDDTAEIREEKGAAGGIQLIEIITMKIVQRQEAQKQQKIPLRMIHLMKNLSLMMMKPIKSED